MKVHETVRVTGGVIVQLTVGLIMGLIMGLSTGLIMVPIIGLCDRNAGPGGVNE